MVHGSLLVGKEKREKKRKEKEGREKKKLKVCCLSYTRCLKSTLALTLTQAGH